MRMPAEFASRTEDRLTGASKSSASWAFLVPGKTTNCESEEGAASATFKDLRFGCFTF